MRAFGIRKGGFGLKKRDKGLVDQREFSLSSGLFDCIFADFVASL